VRHVEPADRESAFGRDALNHEPVRGEVAAVDQDLVAAPLRVHCRPQQFVEQYRRRVGHDRLPRRSTERHRGQPVAEAGGLDHPTLVPTPDEPPAPRPIDELGEPRCSDLQWPTQ
jgi:hypothetical protein